MVAQIASLVAALSCINSSLGTKSQYHYLEVLITCWHSLCIDHHDQCKEEEKERISLHEIVVPHDLCDPNHTWRHKQATQLKYTEQKEQSNAKPFTE